ncbi:MAG TPA: hypothetical protein DIT54_00260 [Lachnospiraceae bacterium]|nr:hypothetical protein [Lachnospiraceae bacterium]
MEKEPLPMIKKKKNSYKNFFLPILYLIVFSITCFLFWSERTKQEEITIKTPLTYSGYDVFENEICVGQYYYSFSKEGLQFYLLNPRENSTLSTPLSLTGKMESNTEEIKQLKKHLSSITQFSTKELNALTTDTFFLEQRPLSTKQWVMIGIACLFALFSILSCMKTIIERTKKPLN